ncbi:glycosyltransferase family 2 protein [Bordetella genomosp. 6]|uniref:Glycosyl transferase family 2 n=1 Tax=Bordetella genomosp. 6 TaxID=463024 RepID=A0ABX4FIJ7_9BORD|nr:glycosyltransferase family A protein [Bordetella genomosp. 6]OZI82009.1 glycosyl transferase family 2 [Bordetella genomosp. 6]
MNLRASVVIPTFRRAALLQRCLLAVLRQRLPPSAYEIIVCDDAASEATRRQVEALADRHPGGPALRYVAVRGTRGPAGARNAGWQSARAPVIAFTDDDTIADPDWLAEGLAALDPGTDAVAGTIDVPLGPRPTDYERDQAGLARAEFATANCFVRRDALQRTGGFDPRYRMAWREDSDLHFALLEAGCVVRRAPRARVLHPVRPTPFAAGLRMQKKIVFDTLLYGKYPRLYRERVRRGPPWFYLAVTLALAAAAGLALVGLWRPAGAAVLAWLALTLWFFGRRLRAVSRAPAHVAELLLTSCLIPPLSIAWRLVGAWRFGPRLP